MYGIERRQQKFKFRIWNYRHRFHPNWVPDEAYAPRIISQQSITQTHVYVDDHPFENALQRMQLQQLKQGFKRLRLNVKKKNSLKITAAYWEDNSNSLSKCDYFLKDSDKSANFNFRDSEIFFINFHTFENTGDLLKGVNKSQKKIFELPCTKLGWKYFHIRR